MQLYCTRPGCSKPVNHCPDLDDPNTLKTIQQKYCTTCGMPLILVGRYLPTQFLGQGGFGTTFLGRDRYTPGLRECVVKQFQPSGNLNPAQLKIAQDFFEREAAVLEKLGNKHPQIPDLFAFFELQVDNPLLGKPDGFFYLVQEFIDGQTLEAELEQKGRFPETAALQVLREVLKILQFVHANGSIHRDIKPSNIMRHQDGQLFLLDFGAVKNFAAAGSVKTAAQTPPSIIYSKGYAPPEQILSGVVSESSDLYALAVTCLVLMIGESPEELFDPNTQTWQWRSRLSISPTLGNVLDRMLQPRTGDRFASATDALEALTSQSPLKVVPPPAPPSPSPSPVPPVLVPPSMPAFSTLEVLGGAAFTGFQGGLLAIALISLLGTTILTAGFWVVLLAILIAAQRLRVIEKVDLAILAGISFGVVGFLPLLNRGLALFALGQGWNAILVFALAGAIAAICITSLFRLIYKLLSNFL
jgi:Protein kinase domain